MSGVDLALFPLFSMEVENQCGELTAGMLKIEHQGDDHHVLDSMMRAAHAMKGAARVVNLDCAVHLTHNMEDYFAASIQAKLKVDSAGVDLLLRAVDLLQTIAGQDVDMVASWLDEYVDDVEAIAAEIKVLSKGGVVGPESTSDSAKTTAEASSITSKLSLHAESQHPANYQQKTTGKHQELRLSSHMLDTMMGLAGEAQVASRQLAPIRKELGDMRNTIQSADEMLTIMRAAILDVHAGDTTAYQHQVRRMKSMQDKLNSCFRSLSKQCVELDLQQRQSSSISGRLYDYMVQSRMQSFELMLPGLSRMTRDIARDLGKQVNLNIVGEQTLIDRDIAEHMQAPLQHLIRNALDHGIENREQRLAAGKPALATITLEARHQGGMLLLTVSDDGGGIDAESLRQRIVKKGMSSDELTADMNDEEMLEFLFLPRFSMRDEVSEVSGRGAGLDLVATTIRKLRGRIQVVNRPGEGMCFEVRLPLTLSILPALLVEIKAQLYAIPLARIERVEHCKARDIQTSEGRQFIQYKGKNVGLMQATQVFGLDDSEPTDSHDVVILGEQQHYGFVVDRIVREDDILEKPLDARFGKIENVSAGSVMPDGRVALILDVDDLLAEMQKLAQTGLVRRIEKEQVRMQQVKKILVVDDSITVREAERRLLSNCGYQVSVAVDGMDGWNALRADDFDLLVSDIDMPRMDGIELVSLLRADARLNHLPVIVVSYKDSEEDRMRGMEVGANAYLTKSSFHDDSFIQSVQDLIGDAW